MLQRPLARVTSQLYRMFGRGGLSTKDEGVRLQRVHQAIQWYLEGRVKEAKQLYSALNKERPSDPHVQYGLGLVAFHEGDTASAILLIEQARGLGLDTAEVNANVAVMYLGTGDLDSATTALRRAIHVDPGFGPAYAHMGLISMRAGRTDDALRELSKAVELQPSNAAALNNLGGLLRDIGELRSAIAHFRRARDLSPFDTQILINLGTAEIQANEWAAAESSFGELVRLDPQAAVAWSRLGFAMSRQGRWDDGINACRKACAMQPELIEGLVALGSALGGGGHAEEAEVVLHEALFKDSRNVDASLQLAQLFLAKRNVDGALACLRRAATLNPGDQRVRVELGRCLLSMGCYEEGFELFEARFRALPQQFTAEVHRAAAGLGETDKPLDLRRAKVLVLGEQGFGDQLMMLRYLPLIRSLGAQQIGVACARELMRIVGQVDGVDEVYDLDGKDRLPFPTCVIPMLSLPRLFGTTTDCVPTPPSFLLDAWTHSSQGLDLDVSGDMLVGLAWAGNSTRADPARANFTLETLELLLDVDGTQFVSLQKERLGTAESYCRWGERLLDPMGACSDFMDTGSVVRRLDLVITVDTAIAHLAASLGITTWLILKAGGEWRWGVESDTSVWYPSIRIFRQRLGDPWSVVVTQVRDALALKVASVGP